MIITYGQGKELVAKYAGKAGHCADDVEVDLFLKEVIQLLLERGASGSVRKWEFITNTGMFTAPPDLELPLKVKVGSGHSSVGFGTYAQSGHVHGGHADAVYDKWYSFYDSSTLNDCVPAERGLVEDPNVYFTAFDPPKCGARLLVVPFCKEDEDAQLIISGLDEEGKEIFMPHKGDRDFSGEVLRINKDTPKYTQKRFTKITGIQKTPTKHYVRLYAFNETTKKGEFLAQYKPLDTQPSFRRFRVVGFDCSNCVKVTVLGRIRFCDNYHDNDILPVSSIRAIKLMAQQIQSEDNDNIEAANYKNQRIEQTINNQNQYKRTPEAKLDFFVETSPANLKNMV